MRGASMPSRDHEFSIQQSFVEGIRDIQAVRLFHLEVGLRTLLLDEAGEGIESLTKLADFLLLRVKCLCSLIVLELLSPSIQPQLKDADLLPQCGHGLLKLLPADLE